MVKFKKHIEKYIVGKNVLVLFILTNIVYAYMLLVTISATMEFSNGMQLLDMMPAGYHLEYVNKLFSTIGDNGRQMYLTRQIPVDMIYPLLFGICYAAMMAYLLKKLSKLNTSYRYLCLLPVIAGIADYIENIGIISMLNKYPNVTETTVNITSTFSVIKSVSTSIYFLALLVVFIVLGVRRMKKSSSKNIRQEHNPNSNQ